MTDSPGGGAAEVGPHHVATLRLKAWICPKINHII